MRDNKSKQSRTPTAPKKYEDRDSATDRTGRSGTGGALNEPTVSDKSRSARN